MRRSLLFLMFLLPVPAWATFSAPTQIVFNNACAASSSCAVTVSAIGAGHLLVVLAHIGNTQTLSSVTAAGETFTVLAGGQASCHFQGGGNTTELGCAYALKSVGGATTVTCNWSGTASASNTSCGFYEVAFTAPRVFVETNTINGSNGSAATFPGANFANNYLTFINGTNDIIFQLANVSTGTVSAINTSFVLDNHTGQVADAHRLNTFDNTAPTWTNSGAATSLIAGLSFGEDYNPNTAGAIPATTLNNGLQLSYSGSVGTRLVTVTSPGLFRLVFDEADAWGIAEWYDLVNDPGATTNLIGPAYGFMSLSPSSAEPGLFNRTYYDFQDAKGFARSAFYYFPRSPRQLSILEYNATRIVIETKSEPTVTAEAVINNLIGTIRYYIYPNGQIYIHCISTLTNAGTINPGHLFSDTTLEDPTRTSAGPPDTEGWIRASPTQNPYVNAGLENYLFAYWGTGTSAPYTNWTKASILLVRNPNNLHDAGPIIHSWPSGPGYGVLRWGWQNGDTFTIGAGGTETEDMLIQLGAQNSTVLPNITSSAVAGPIAAAYIANPTPPGPSLEASAAVNQNTTMQFTATDPGTWACSGCAGSINASSGLYTAPATVTPQQSDGGFQLLPNNHIYNTRIDGLSVDPNSATWIAGAGTVAFGIADEIAFPMNYCNPSTPTKTMSFLYTTGNNGAFQFPAYPNIFVESGWLTAANSGNLDHHFFCIDTTTGTFQEVYQYNQPITTTAASVTGNVAKLTFATDPTLLGYGVGINFVVDGFTGGDTYLNSPGGGSNPITAVTTNSISYSVSHIDAVASTTGTVSKLIDCPSAGLNTCNATSGIRYLNSSYGLPNAQGGGVDAAGLHVIPLQLRLQEMERAVATSGTINHAFRMTLSNSYICGSSTLNACGNNPAGTRHIWPATAEAFAGGGVVPYGARFRLKAAFDISGYSNTAKIVLTALKNYGVFLADGGTGWASQMEAAPWPAAYITALKSISIAPSNFEAVDESGLEIAATSGETTNNRETVTFTRTSDSATATVDVALMGVAVGLPNDVLNIQAGTAAQQLTAFVSGGANNTVTWSVSPAITGGSLTSGGLLTPPATIAAVTAYTVTATSTDNGAIAAPMTVYIFPTGSIRFRPAATAAYTDTHGKVWAPNIQGNGGISYDLTGSCSWTGTDIDEYKFQLVPYHDGAFKFSVPNGNYTITAKFATLSAVGRTIVDLESNGAIQFRNLDINTLAPGTCKPIDFQMTQTVTNGTLFFVIRAAPINGSIPTLSAIQIDGGIFTGTTLSPGRTVTSGRTIK